MVRKRYEERDGRDGDNKQKVSAICFRYSEKEGIGTGLYSDLCDTCSLTLLSSSVRTDRAVETTSSTVIAVDVTMAAEANVAGGEGSCRLIRSMSLGSSISSDEALAPLMSLLEQDNRLSKMADSNVSRHNAAAVIPLSADAAAVV